MGDPSSDSFWWIGGSVSGSCESPYGRHVAYEAALKHHLDAKGEAGAFCWEEMEDAGVAPSILAAVQSLHEDFLNMEHVSTCFYYYGSARLNQLFFSLRSTHPMRNSKGRVVWMEWQCLRQAVPHVTELATKDSKAATAELSDLQKAQWG